MIHVNRRLRVAFLSALASCLSHAAISRADNFPDHGAAPGSQSGDDATPFSGIAQAPGADLFSGAATTKIAIEVPPGRLNMTPEIALSYSSHAGKSPYGYGWTLPIARISRSTKFGVPKCDNDEHTFVLDLPGASGELIETTTPNRYRLRVEGAYLSIGLDETNNYWVVIDKTGTKFTFGKTPSVFSRTGKDTANPDCTFSWLLEQVEDTFGNSINYKYLDKNAAYEASPPGLPSEITYGGIGNPSQPGHIFKVEFMWDELWVGVGEPDDEEYPATTYAEGFKRLVQGRRLDKIRTRALVGTSTVAREYKLVHTVPHDNHGILRLDHVELYATRADDPSMEVTLPTSKFVYAPAVQLAFPTGADRADYAIELPQLVDGPFRGDGSPQQWDMFDLNGDAIVDYVWPLDFPDHAGKDVRLGTGTDDGFEAVPISWNWPAGRSFVRDTDTENGVTSTKSSVFDVTGDGLPDFVSVYGSGCNSGTLWCVWRNTPFGFADDPEFWSVPASFDEIRRTDGDADMRKDTLDMNGDGLPDLVDTSGWSPTNKQWKVYRNTGSGFDTSPTFLWSAPEDRISAVGQSDGRVSTHFGLIDMNGDGLPDFVDSRKDPSEPAGHADYTTRWQVYLNNGKGFDGVAPAAPTLWVVEGAENEFWLTRDYSRNHVSGTETETVAELVDVTGDGLPDAVRGYRADDANRGVPAGTCPGGEPVCTSGSQNCCLMNVVFVNTGASFAQPVAMHSWVETAGNGKLPVRRTSANNEVNDGQEFDLFDFDGDGLVDIVERTIVAGSEKLHLYRNPASPRANGSGTPLHERSKPNALLSMSNGIGGETFVEYDTASLAGDERCIATEDLDGTAGACSPYPTWVVTAVTAVDTFAHSPAVVTHYGYRDAYYDGGEREPRGFGTVWEVAPSGVTTVRQYHQDTACAGRLNAERVLASKGPSCTEFDLKDITDPCNPILQTMQATENDWDCADALAAIDSPTTPDPVLLNGSTVTPYRRPAPDTAVVATDPFGRELTKKTTYEYGAYGNEKWRTIESVQETQGVPPSFEAVTIRTDYEAPSIVPNGSLPGEYVVARPKRIYSFYGADPENSSDRFQDREIDYDNDFAVTDVSECQSWNASGDCSTSITTHYSGYTRGMPSTQNGPGKATTLYDYDAHFLFAETTTHPDGFTTVVEAYDYRLGKPTDTRDKNGQLTQIRYDALGRVRQLWGSNFASPGPSELDVTYVYPDLLAGKRGSVKREKPITGPTITFFDGFAREVATKKIVQVAGTGGTYLTRTRIEGLKVYDDAGRVKYGILPYQLTSDPVFDELVEPIFSAEPSVAHTAMTYDAGTGGLAVMRLPDDSIEIHDSTVPGVTAAEDADGAVTIEYADGLGRVARTDRCTSMPALENGTSCPASNLLSRTEFVYDGLDRVIQTWSIDSDAPNDPNRNVVVETVEYDGLGNVASRSDANSNVWRYQYDRNSGLLVRTDTSRGDWIRLRYDSANRVTREISKDGSGRGQKHGVKYRYFDETAGAVNRGRLERVGFKGPKKNSARVDKFYTYDARGLVATETIEFHGAHSDESEYTFTNTYDDEDRLIVTTYPAASGGTDSVETFYDISGNAHRVTRNGFELAKAGYDVLGHQTHVRYGNSFYDLALYETAENNSYLKCLRTTRKLTGTPPSPADACTVDGVNDLRVVEYMSRDLTGRILWIKDRLHTETTKLYSNEHNVTYWPDGRLHTVGYSASGLDTLEYDGLGRLKKRNSTNYFYDWTYTPNPTTLREQPYALSRTVVGAATTAFDYDLNGNRVVRGSKSYSYTPTGALAEVEHSSGPVQHNGYGPDGNRIVRYDDGAKAVHYYDNRFEIQGDELVRHFYLGGRRVASDRIAAPAGLSLGSSTVHLDALAGSISANWSDWNGFGGADGAAALGRALQLAILLLGLAVAASRRTREGKLATLTATFYVVALLPVPSSSRDHSLAGLGVPDAHAQEVLNWTVYYHADHIGSVQAISNSNNATGELIRYDVFGKVRGTFQKSSTVVVTENPTDASANLGYTGHEPDEKTGLVYFGARHLDPDDGHFTSIDPERQYASPYVHGDYDPLNGRDPDGKWFGGIFSVEAFFSAAVSHISGVGGSSELAGVGAGTRTGSAPRVAAGDSGNVTRDARERSEATTNPDGPPVSTAVDASASGATGNSPTGKNSGTPSSSAAHEDARYSYEVSRPALGEAGERYDLVSHNFIVANARYLGDPSADVMSWGQNSEWKVGRVDATTEGFSAGTHAADMRAWRELDGVGLPHPDVSPIPATTADVRSWANRLEESKDYAAVGGRFGLNSNSASHAVANRAAGYAVATPGYSRWSPGADNWRQVPFTPARR